MRLKKGIWGDLYVHLCPDIVNEKFQMHPCEYTHTPNLFKKKVLVLRVLLPKHVKTSTWSAVEVTGHSAPGCWQTIMDIVQFHAPGSPHSGLRTSPGDELWPALRASEFLQICKAMKHVCVPKVLGVFVCFVYGGSWGLLVLGCFVVWLVSFLFLFCSAHRNHDWAMITGFCFILFFSLCVLGK